MRARPTGILAAAASVAAVGAATSWAVGPTPGFAPGGVLSRDGSVRYVAVTGSTKTVVQAVAARTHRVLRSSTLAGLFGVPLVAYDGSAGGLSRDGRILVLETAPGGAATTFAVLDPRSLKVRRTIRLGGAWAFDALSPGGRTLYLIQNLPTPGALRYLVRAYDLRTGRLLARPIADKTEAGPMTGYPVSRATSSSGAWVYTLYYRGDGERPFVHALDTSARVAFCLDLNQKGAVGGPGDVRLGLSRDQRRLIVRLHDGTVLARMAVPSPG